MKGKITTGIWLIFIGIIVLLDNFNVIDFNFYALLKYWPLLVVAFGINLLVKDKDYGQTVKIGTTVALCLFFTYIGFTSKEKFNVLSNISVNSKTTQNSDLVDSIAIMETADSSEAKLEFNIGGATINLNSTEAYFIHANSPQNGVSFALDQDDHEFEISTSLKSKKSQDNFVNIGLSQQKIWDLTFNIGASKVIGDLAKIRLANLEVNSGATDLSLKLPQPYQKETKIEINTAASNCKFSIPKDVACAIELATVLSSNQLEGFTKKDGLWKTDNYDTADKKYIIELNGAANSLKIDRY